MAYGADSSVKLSTLTTDVVCMLFVIVCLRIPGVDGHGRLLDPPSRSSMWRMGFNNPPNYDDNQLFCGGFSTQWERYGGKCGLCGDPWPGPRENEPGGKYANGVITRKYREGQIIDVYVQLTANHKGYFEFRLCQHDNPLTNISRECLDRHLLVVDRTGQTRYMVPYGDYATTQDLRIKLRLPRGLTCSACVLQWKYNAGNSWGVDPDTHKGCIGCGPQEQFYGCADVAVGHGEVVTGVPPKRFTSAPQKPHTEHPPVSYVPSSTGEEHAPSTEEVPPGMSDSDWSFGIASVFGSRRTVSSTGSPQAAALSMFWMLLFSCVNSFSW